MKKKLSVIINDDNNGFTRVEKELKRTNLYKKNQMSIIVMNSKLTSKQGVLFVDKTASLSDTYNEILNRINSKYVTFINSSDIFNGKNYDRIIRFMDSNDYKCAHIKSIHLFNIKKIKEKNNVEKKFDFCLSSYVLDLSLMKKIGFTKKYADECLLYTILKMVNHVKKIGYLNKCKLYYTTLNINVADYHNYYKKEWYLNTLSNLHKLLKENPSDFIIKTTLNVIGKILLNNMNAKNKSVLCVEEVDKFWKKLSEILKIIPNKNIDEFFVQTKLPIFINSILYKTKFLDDKQYLTINNNNPIIKCNNNILYNFDNCDVRIKVLDYYNGNLKIDGEFYYPEFLQDGAKIIAQINKKNVELVPNEVYSATKFFGQTKHKCYTFNVEIPAEEIYNNSIISFKYIHNKTQLELPISFHRPSSKLHTLFHNSFYRFDSYFIFKKGNNLIIKNNNRFNSFFKEIKLYFEYIFKSKSAFFAMKCIALRIIYWITKPLYRQNIWISYDKLFKGGDNGEYFYHYAKKQDDNIKKYYVINKDTFDYQRLKKSHENILVYKSLKHYLAVLNCSIMFSTHANPFDYNGFTANIVNYFKDLLTFKTVCIQHGLSVNQIAKFQNRVYANTYYYFCASEFEITNLNKPEYDYHKYNYLKLTGVPRYDGLKSNDKNIILITPTWRQSSSSKLVKLNMQRQYNNEFKNSKYYKIYNNLINDNYLIDAAKQKGYKIIFLLHPAISSQQKDFKGNEYVQVISATSNMNYEKILTESSLMVTDYSGVQFDFAYMRKPIIYFHPKELPPHYEEGGLIYSKDGFGPIVEESKELIDLLKKYINNNCEIEDKYRKRADKFFKYDDYQNCQRIYEVALKFQQQLDQ